MLDLKKLYARNLTRFYKTVYEIAQFHYPKFKFLAWKFKKIERGHFNKRENVLKYIHWLENKLSIKKKKDWYIYGYENFENNNGHSLLAKFSHSPLKILQYCYPKYPWDVLRFGNPGDTRKLLLKSLEPFHPEISTSPGSKRTINQSRSERASSFQSW